MSNNAQILTVIGTLPALSPGEFVDVTPGLRDQAGNALIANSVCVNNESFGEIVWILFNNGTVRFINNGTVDTATVARYKISHDHTIQTQYPTPEGSVGPISVSSSAIHGTLEASRSEAQAFAAGVPTPIEFPFVNTLEVGRIRFLVSQTDPENFRFEANGRALEVQAKVSCESVAVAEEAVTLQIFETVGGTVLATATGTSTAGEPVTLSAQCIIPITVTNNVLQVRLLSTAGGATLASERSASVIIQTLD